MQSRLSFVIVIIDLEFLFKLLNTWICAKGARVHRNEEPARRRASAASSNEVEERVRVLERIVTDERFDLKQQFRDLEARSVKRTRRFVERRVLKQRSASVRAAPGSRPIGLDLIVEGGCDGFHLGNGRVVTRDHQRFDIPRVPFRLARRLRRRCTPEICHRGLIGLHLRLPGEHLVHRGRLAVAVLATGAGASHADSRVSRTDRDRGHQKGRQNSHRQHLTSRPLHRDYTAVGASGSLRCRVGE